MEKRIVRLYEILLLDEQTIERELNETLKDSVNILQETKKAILNAAYDLEDRRRFISRLLGEKQPVRVQEDDFLWACFAPRITKSDQTLFRSFYVRSVLYEKDKISLSTRLTYEKKKNWFDLNIIKK